MMQLTALQLKEKDPQQYQKELWNFYPDHDWWDYIEADFIETCAPLGVRVDCIRFDSYWHATFEGRIELAQWMQSQKLDEKWYPLWLTFEQDGSYARVSVSYRNNLSFDLNDNIAYSHPEGVFSDMAQQDWEDMLQEQVEPFYSALEDWARDQCQELRAQLRDAYEWEVSEENFLQMCEANELTFEYEGDDDEVQA